MRTIDDVTRQRLNAERRLRNLAHRQSLVVYKSRRPGLHGPWFVADPFNNVLLSSEFGMSLDETEQFLTHRSLDKQHGRTGQWLGPTR